MLKHLSISQLKLHAQNPRRWVLQYLEHIREEPSPHLEFGTSLHNFLETLLLTGEVEGKFQHNEPMREWYVDRKSLFKKYNWRIEDSFKVFLDPRLPPFKGRIDMWAYNEEKNRVLVLDHKTCNPRYVEDEKSLRYNWQLSLYMYALNPHNFTTLYEDGDWEQDYNKEIIGSVGHHAFIKTRDFDISEVRNIETNLHRNRFCANIKSIKEEAFNMLTTIDLYESQGLKAVPLGGASEKWYGSKDPLWPCINLEESVKECKVRLNG